MSDEFDFGQGQKDGDDGMDKAYGAKRSHAWLHDAGYFFMSLAVGDQFTADDLVKRCGLPDEGQNKNNVIGSWFNGLARAKFIRWTGATYKSERVTRHTGMNRVWVKLK
jgi:hypothetical protein